MRSTVKSDGPATVLYSISYFYDVFGTAIRAFTRRLARSRAIFDGGRNVFGWLCTNTYTGHHWHGVICLGKKRAFSLRAYRDSGATFTQRNTGLRGEKCAPGVPVISLPLGCDGAQQRVRFLSVPSGTLALSLHNGLQASRRPAPDLL